MISKVKSAIARRSTKTQHLGGLVTIQTSKKTIVGCQSSILIL